MKTADTNENRFITLKSSKKKPKEGDIFVFKMGINSKYYYFGRVINVETKLGGGEGIILIYLYNVKSEDKSVVPPLMISDLLLPPIGTNAQAWKRGVFETVGNVNITEKDIYSSHGFRNFKGQLYDEYGNECKSVPEVVGVWGVTGIDGIEEQLISVLKDSE